MPPVELFVKLGSTPTQADTNNEVLLTNCLLATYPAGTLPGNSISIGPAADAGTLFRWHFQSQPYGGACLPHRHAGVLGRGDRDGELPRAGRNRFWTTR